MVKPLRPIDAVFVHLEGRYFVIYYRGTLWQLPRLKLDWSAWQRKQPYTGDAGALYLSRQQSVSDPKLAPLLRTLNLPIAIAGSSLPKFESWWEANGYVWLTVKLSRGESPLAAFETTDFETSNSLNSPQTSEKIADQNKNQPQQTNNAAPNTDHIFAEMLADLTEEVIHRRPML